MSTKVNQFIVLPKGYGRGGKLGEKNRKCY